MSIDLWGFNYCFPPAFPASSARVIASFQLPRPRPCDGVAAWAAKFQVPRDYKLDATLLLFVACQILDLAGDEMFQNALHRKVLGVKNVECASESSRLMRLTRQPGSGAHSKLLLVTPWQNRALRLIAGACRTAPTLAPAVDSSVPPIDIYLDFLRARSATLPPNHPIVICLPDHITPTNADTSTIPFSLPYTPTHHYRSKRKREAAESKRYNQNRDATQL